MNPKNENKVIGPEKSNEVSKSPWECRVSKRAKEAQRKQVGQGCPRERQNGHRSSKVRKPVAIPSHWEKE